MENNPELKILVIGKYIENDDSYDYINIIQPLKELGHFVYQLTLTDNTLENSNSIITKCKSIQPNLLFIIPVKDEIDLKILASINQSIKKLVYFFDDTWRILYSLKWAEEVDYIVTSDINWKLNFLKFKNKVIFSPFSVNTKRYLNKNNPNKKYDISFVGQYHPYREWIINKLINNGLMIKVYGEGWKNSKILTHNEMIMLFNDTKINLNLSNCVNYDLRFILDFKNNSLLSKLKALKLIFISFFKKDMKIYEMVKGRFFEINSCGGFQLSFYAQGLEHQYQIGSEIEIFTNFNELLRKVKYYLTESEERELIALKGYEKTIEQHSSLFRLNQIISKIKF